MKPCSSKGRYVQEHVGAAVIGRNEAVAALGVEEFYGACCHYISPLLSAFYQHFQAFGFWPRISRNSGGPLINRRFRRACSSSGADLSPSRSIASPAISDDFLETFA